MLTLFSHAALDAESVTAGAQDMFSSVMDQSTPAAERAMEALRVFAIGLGTVFAVLAVICAILYLFKLFFYEIPKRRQHKETKETTLPAADTAPAVDTPQEDEGEIVAAITAALSVVLEKPAASFRIVSFKRTK